MKIAIKYNQTVKIFNGDKTYLTISQFISKSFNLAPSQITLTYLDEEGDSITLASDSDLLSACEINNDKKFLKIRVALSNSEDLLEKEEFEVMSDSPVVQESLTISSRKEKEATKEVEKDEPQCKKDKCEEKKVECSKNKRETSSSSEQGHHGRRGGFKHFMRKFEEKIAEKVDERIKNLIPCIKSQIEGGNPIKTFSVPNSLLHEGIECKGCLSKPICGIRYKCLVCPIFNLCQKCEGSIEHEHNLLKMKKIEDESEKKEEFQFKGPKGFWKHGHHGRGHHGFPGHHGFNGHHGFPGFPGPHWEHRERSHHQRGFSHSKEGRVTRKLAMIFGGQPKDYNEFAKANENLRKFEIVTKYAQEKGLNEKLINFRCEKVASRLGKQPGEFIQYVKANMDLKPRDIIRKLIDEGKVQNPWKERRWGGKDCPRWGWGDKQTFLKQKSERKEENSNRRQSQRKSPLRGTSQEKKEKAIILDELISLFGSSDLKNYFNIIEQHFSMGKEVIIQKVIDSKFLKKSA